MDYDTLTQNIGRKYTVHWGKLEPAENGEFTVSKTVGFNTIYLNSQARTASVVAAPDSWIGRTYHFRKQDCVTLAAEYVDSKLGSNYSAQAHTTKAETLEYNLKGMALWFQRKGLVEVALDDRQENDFVVYDFDGFHPMHVGVCLPSDKMLHHLPSCFSSIDQIDYSQTDKFLGFYRHA